jgi:hypothetical protein
MKSDVATVEQAGKLRVKLTLRKVRGEQRERNNG